MLSLGAESFTTYSPQHPDLGLGPLVGNCACRLLITALIANWGQRKGRRRNCLPWPLERPRPCCLLSHLPHAQFLLCWSQSWSRRPVFQVVSFQWVTGMCVPAKENIKMFGECFRKIAWSRLPRLASMPPFPFPFCSVHV